MASNTDDGEYDWRKSGQWKYDWDRYKDDLDRAHEKLNLHVTHTNISPDYQERERNQRLLSRQEYRTPDNQTPSQKATKAFAGTVSNSNQFFFPEKYCLLQWDLAETF